MKTKELSETAKPFTFENPLNKKTKPKSLRPMRSMSAVRSFKPKTTVAAVAKSHSNEAQA